ncbi:MAG: amidohydrolase family protein [Fermentimonas sp.]|jgi:predicted TIM-barrel fold metal-dependent hydrolase
MIIDIHGHLGNINIAPFWQADERKLEEHLDKAGIDYLCVSSSKSLMYDVQEGNVDLANALENSDKLLGYVTVNPVFPETIKELKYLENSKFVGVKVHPDYHGYQVSSPHAWDFLHQVAERTSLMLFHVSCMPGTGFADAENIARFGAEHPATNIIMAHMAGIFQNGAYPYFPNFQGLEKVSSYMTRCDNIYVDTAHQLMYVYPGVMEKMIELIGVDHIVFGTDCPLQGHMQMKFAMDIIHTLDIPEADKEKIFSGNARKLIKKIKVQ